MNAPTLYDRFIVPEGKRKVAFAADTKVESAGTFTIQREDHTLGNIIRMCVPELRASGRHCTARGNPSAPAHGSATLTLLVPLRSDRQLHADDKVTFAAYQMPHPLVNELKVKARPTL
jgi:DNA-directed RNA polymerase subunit L